MTEHMPPRTCHECGEQVQPGWRSRQHGYRHFLEMTADLPDTEPTDRHLARALAALDRVEALAWDLLEAANRGPDMVTPSDALLLHSIGTRLYGFARDGLYGPGAP